MTSTFRDKETGALKSRLVPTLKEGGIVTDPRSQAYYLVTEQGIANLAGLTVWQRAEQLIALAHPSFREELIRQAEAMKIWKKSNRR